MTMSYDQDVDMNDRYDQWALDSFCYSCSRDESQGIAWDSFNLHRECSAIEITGVTPARESALFRSTAEIGFPSGFAFESEF